MGREIEIFATCPQSKDVPVDQYLEAVANVARWSEQAGCRGILVYTDNGLVDPWLVSQVILQSTERLAPLVAIQPVYMHPYTAAKMVTSLAFLQRRRIYLNMLAGGFKNDLIALGDETPHDERYERTIEYTNIMLDLLRGEAPVTVEGRYYNVKNLSLTPAIPEELFPGVMISGSSPAGLAAAEAIGATAVKYPKPPGEETPSDHEPGYGVRVGVIARENADEAWGVALERFPEDRKGQIAHRMAMSTTDSHWHKQLSHREHGETPDGNGDEREPYWLGPFQNYNTFCPYLVGSYARVAQELAHYVGLGCSTFILDIPPSEEELEHTGVVFREALSAAP